MPIRVLVVEDSLTVRKRLVEVLNDDTGFEVVGEGTNGQEAIELCQQLRPDVVAMDMMMPVMTGLSATEYIMAYCPTPILIVSASINRGEALRTMDALAAGALDVLDKPSGDEADGTWERRFKDALRMVSRIRVIRHPRAKFRGYRGASAAAPVPSVPVAAAGPWDLVAIGASTGGPQALVSLLEGLPGDFPLPILVVLHMDARFEAIFREWLEGYTRMPVRHATDGMPLPERGRSGLWLAPANRHLVVEGDRLRLTDGPERHSCRPSVDVLFDSLARHCGARTVACLLTGMGVDGAAGLLALRNAGAMTIAQDEDSSAVFGMPAEAIRRGAARSVLPLSEIAPALRGLAAASRRGTTTSDRAVGGQT